MANPLVASSSSLVRRAASAFALAALVMLVLMLAAAPDAHAAVQATFMVKQKATRIAWSGSSFPLAFVADSGAPVVAQNLDSVRRSFKSWEIPASGVTFRELPARSAPAGRDGVNSVSVRNDLFAASGLVAFTSWWFDENTGILQEADIQVDPAYVNDKNIERVVEHEAGHFLGLDHSGNLSSAMYPFVGNDSAPLPADDAIGIAALYPGATFAAAGGSLEGTVSASSAPVFGAQVVALDANGSPAATALTDRDGHFEMNVVSGTYRLYAEPLDGPVDGRNLSGIYADAAKNFRTTFFPAPVTVASGSHVAGLDLRANGTTAVLNPRWVGAFAAGTNDISLSSMSARVKSGTTMSIAVGGDGIVAGQTTFALSGPGARRVSDFKYGNGYMYATFEIGNVAAFTPYSILVDNSDEHAALTGAILVEPRSSARPRPIRR